MLSDAIWWIVAQHLIVKDPYASPPARSVFGHTQGMFWENHIIGFIGCLNNAITRRFSVVMQCSLDFSGPPRAEILFGVRQTIFKAYISKRVGIHCVYQTLVGERGQTPLLARKHAVSLFDDFIWEVFCELFVDHVPWGFAGLYIIDFFNAFA